MRPGDLKVKDPSAVKTSAFNLDAYLAPGVTLVSPTVTVTGPDAGLAVSGVSLAANGRQIEYQLVGGSAHRRYRVTAHWSTNETPPQSDARSFEVEVQAL